MMPVIEGQFMFPGFQERGSWLLCRWCDDADHLVASMMSDEMWSELEMLEHGSWPRRIQDLLPQADPPSELT